MCLFLGRAATTKLRGTSLVIEPGYRGGCEVHGPIWMGKQEGGRWNEIGWCWYRRRRDGGREVTVDVLGSPLYCGFIWKGRRGRRAE